MARKRAGSGIDMRKFAVAGATARLQDLMTEARGIVAAFPELARELGIVAAGAARGAARGAVAGARKASRSRKPMTTAQRRAVSVRMKKYWASRRKAKSARSPKSS